MYLVYAYIWAGEKYMHKLWQFLNFTVLVKINTEINKYLGNHMERNEWVECGSIGEISLHRFYRGVLIF